MSRLSQGLSKLNSAKPGLGGGGGGSGANGANGNKSFEELKRHIHGKLVEKLDFSRVKDLQSDALRKDIRRVVEHLCDTENPLLNRMERERLID
jgi:pilus assembly protein CpaF